jgi:hypothetical protein
MPSDAGFGEQVRKAFAEIVPADAKASTVAGAIVDVVGALFGRRPFRVHIDPTRDRAGVGFAVLDRVRAEMLRRVGLSDLLKPRVLVWPSLRNARPQSSRPCPPFRSSG